ncbi:MAG: glycosyl hydrolase [Terriglobia bacterium]
MLRIDPDLTPEKLLPRIDRLFDLSAGKIREIAAAFESAQGSPVFTVQGAYVGRDWTEWTEGFHYGSALVQYDATGEAWFLDWGRRKTVERMAAHVTHTGVHDHGFNNVSTYGNLLRLATEGRIEASEFEKRFYALALEASGAVQAARWSLVRDGRGYIYSFNGAHSLFADTIRSLRSLAVAHRLGHVLRGENDRRISLLDRLVQHAAVTAEFAVYYGESRDAYDVRGRVAHESLFNPADGAYRCPSTQQGYSPFTTWTRALAWIMCGYAEQLEFLETLPDHELETLGGRGKVESMMRRAAQATCDYYLEQAATDGIPYWDTGAPNLTKLGDWLKQPSDPFNSYEPVDSSAAAIAAQGLWRFGTYLNHRPEPAGRGDDYRQAALTIAQTLFDPPYLSTDPRHQGLILHSIYHRPRGWDYVPPGRQVPCGESSMWGDYHARELALLIQRAAKKEAYPAFFNVQEKS